MLTVKNLTIQYGNNEPALKDFNLSISSGEIVCIVGESGSGKSTAITSLMGDFSNNKNIVSGDIVFEDESLKKYTNKQWSHIRGTKIAMIFQDSIAMLNPIRKIGSQYIEYIRCHKNIDKKEAYNIALENLKAMGFQSSEQVMNSYGFQLSGGMCQRVAIAMAMTFKPKILIADEPTSALDATTQKQIIMEMLTMRKKNDTAIIMVTHNLALAAFMADKIIVMKQGNIVESGLRDEIINNPQSDYTKKLLRIMPNMEDNKVE